MIYEDCEGWNLGFWLLTSSSVVQVAACVRSWREQHHILVRKK